MSREATLKANVEWHQRHQECKLSILVVVDQVRGTHATIYETRFELPYKLVTTKLASFASEDLDNSLEAMWMAIGKVSVAYSNRVLRAKELETRPY